MPELGIVPYRLILLFISLLVLRRIPALLLLYRWVPEIRGWKEALFSGHFGEDFLDRRPLYASFTVNPYRTCRCSSLFSLEFSQG